MKVTWIILHILFISLALMLYDFNLGRESLCQKSSHLVSLKSIIEFDTTEGFRLKKNVQGITGCVTDSAIVNIDKNHRRLIKHEPSMTKRTIHIFGDSFAFGFGVGDDDNFPALLQKLYQDKSIKVINYS